MMSEFTEVTSESWFGRIGRSIKSVLVGLVLFLAAFPLLWWNENRAVRAARSLDLVEKAAIELKAAEVQPENEDKLVLVGGKATTTKSARDTTFRLRVEGIKLRRRVEMYQWDEEVETRSQKKLGGGKKTVKTYRYREIWSGSLIKSSGFKKSRDHENPARFKYESKSFYPELVELGAFELNKALLEQVNKYEPVTLSSAEVKKMPRAIRAKAELHEGWLYLGKPNAPKIGDHRILFQVAKPLEVTVLAQQRGNGFTAFMDEEYKLTYHVLKVGLKTKAVFIQEMRKSAQMLTWLLRLVGLIVMGIGIGLIFQPLAVVADVVPFLGDLLGFGIFLFALLGAAVLSCLTIGLAWTFYRPLLGIPLLLGSIAVIVAFKVLGRSRQKPAPVQSESRP